MKQVNQENSPVEIWGGVECSIVRIHGTVHDQLKMNGHEDRIDDFELFADLGITKLRYPLLWEKYASQKELFFPLHDKRLHKLRSLGITPVAGLLHHGSGPFETDMMQPGFPELLAEYAFTIAKHYPWLEYYTPVNEPLTTARFSGLYGIWYPHHKDDYSFARIYLNEMKGIILSMQRIRQVNPKARLLQTEDIAHVHSTPRLGYQANLENQRTWLTYDILTGNLKPGHPFWNYFLEAGISLEDLKFFTDNSCPPDICGFNYYVTSERFLDDRIQEYPDYCVGGNDFHDYADIEVVRVPDFLPVGIETLLRQAAQRYNLPIALSEIHLACTREEQMRWFDEAYRAVVKLKREGIDIRGITAWSLLGSFDWNTLLQLKGQYYESGVFDIRSGEPRATALAGLIRSCTRGSAGHNDILQVPGWWRRNVRIRYHVPTNIDRQINTEYNGYKNVRPVLIIGNGPMAFAFRVICRLRGLPCVTEARDNFRFITEESISRLIDLHNPLAVVNTGGFSEIDKAELSPVNCYRENTLYPRQLARVCLMKNVRMLTFSTDQVFNGKKRQPYIEGDETDPINVFGMSKKLAEENILHVNPDVLIVRSGLLMNPFNPDDFLQQMLYSDRGGRSKYAFSDIIISPGYLPDVINTALDLLIDNERGIWHISGPEAVSYFDFARLATGIAGMAHTGIRSVPSIRLPGHARRPAYSALRSASGIVLPSLEISISNYLNEAEKNYRA